MILFSKALLGVKKNVEQHIISLSSSRLNNLSYNDDFSVIYCSSQPGNIDTGYLYFYLDDMSKYKLFCYNADGVTELKVGSGSTRWAVYIPPYNYEIGTYIFKGGIKEIDTDKIVQTFTVTYTKVD